MALGDSDKQEASNIKEEESMSKNMYAELKKLMQESKDLRKEYKKLLKTGKKLRNIIAAKEKKNAKELAQMQEMQQTLVKESVKDIRAKTAKLKKEEQHESTLSKEEAIILQDMLNELHGTYKHGEDIINAGRELYNMIKNLYTKDLEDYQLEVEEIKSE